MDKLEFLLKQEESRGNYKPSVAAIFAEAQSKCGPLSGTQFPFSHVLWIAES